MRLQLLTPPKTRLQLPMLLKTMPLTAQFQTRLLLPTQVSQLRPTLQGLSTLRDPMLLRPTLQPTRMPHLLTQLKMRPLLKTKLLVMRQYQMLRGPQQMQLMQQQMLPKHQLTELRMQQRLMPRMVKRMQQISQTPRIPMQRMLPKVLQTQHRTPTIVLKTRQKQTLQMLQPPKTQPNRTPIPSLTSPFPILKRNLAMLFQAKSSTLSLSLRALRKCQTPILLMISCPILTR